MSLGSKLRTRRRELDLTLQNVSCITGLNTSHISGIEHGKVLPSLKAFIKICNALYIDDFNYFLMDLKDQIVEEMEEKFKNE